MAPDRRQDDASRTKIQAISHVRRLSSYWVPAHRSLSPLKYPVVDPRTSGVCLITKDPQREYKDLLERQGIKFISRVVGVEKLKGKFKAFEARRLLLKENAMFLADERVIPLLPRLLGPKWFDAKKYVGFWRVRACQLTRRVDNPSLSV